jgi:hypothetical protein
MPYRRADCLGRQGRERLFFDDLPGNSAIGAGVAIGNLAEDLPDPEPEG